MIELDSICLVRGGAPILDRITLAVTNEVVALVGPSGSGKTSLLRVLLGLDAPTKGRVSIAGRLASHDGRVDVLPEERNVAMVFQDLALWPHLSLQGNLAFGLISRRVPKATREQRIAELLERVGLTGKEHRHPAELSGGERQRAAIARALVLEPRAILLDEPLANLDAHRKRQLIELFREIFKERKAAVVYVTHDLREAAALADRIAVLENGRVVQEGTLDDLRSRPATEFVGALIADLVWKPSP